MSIRNLRTLVAVFKQGSFAAAADQLCLTQSAISQQIRALEDDLGVKLFDRSGRSPQLNTDGHEACQRALAILQQYDALGEGLGPAGELQGNLSVGAIYTVQITSLAPVLAELRSHYPELFIRVFRGMSAELVGRVEEGELDAVIVTGPPLKQARDCDWHTLSSERFYVISPIDYPEVDATELLQRYPFIRFDRRAWAGTLIDDELRKQGLRPNEAMELDSLQAALSMVQQGLGVTIMPLDQATVGEISSRFRLTPFGQPALSREIGLYQRRKHNRPQLVQLLLAGMTHFYSA
ncbi:MAG: LysR family transcriptional regulator [Motiliproteus sp.]